MWHVETERLVAAISENFEKRFRIKLNVKNYKPWFSDSSQSSMFALLNDLRAKVKQEESDVVIGITSQYLPEDDVSGVATYLHGYIMLREVQPEFRMRTILIHELCHLFGAIDLDEPGSIMDFKNPGNEFDEFTEKVILLNRDRDFNPYLFPLP